MDELQEKIKQTYEEMSQEEKIEYLQESIDFHRKTAHFHMYMERHFATQLQELTGETDVKFQEIEADQARAVAQQAEA